MNKETAVKIFEEHTKKDYKKVEILNVEERDDMFLFDFIEEGDEFPVDYPVVFVKKNNGETGELSFLNAKDRKIIYGRK